MLVAFQMFADKLSLPLLRIEPGQAIAIVRRRLAVERQRNPSVPPVTTPQPASRSTAWTPATPAPWLAAKVCPLNAVGASAATRKFVDQVLVPKKSQEGR